MHMKIVTTIIAFLLFLSVGAQTATNHQTNSAKAKTTKSATVKDGFKMKDDMMLAVKNGVTTTMSVNVTLKNGTVVKTDGSVITLAGKTIQLKNGQAIDSKGRITGAAVAQKGK